MINLKFQYKRLFTIKINHNYYPEGVSNDFYFVPTRRTVKLIDKMSMLVRSNDGEINVLYDASRLDLLHHRLKNSNVSESKFSFMIFTNNQYFVNITDIPVDLKDKVFYCSNKNLGITKGGTLHTNEFVGAKDLYDTLPLELEKNEEGQMNYKLTLQNGEDSGAVPVKVHDGYQVDMAELLDGNYKIFGNDKELSSFVNIESKTKGSPIGFVDIFLNKSVKQEMLNEIEDNELKAFDYSLRFNSRSVYWKYIVVPTYLKRVKELAVLCQKGKGKLSFKSIGEEIINDKKTITFISSEQVKFKKFYEYEIQLKKKEGEGGGKTLIKKMSYASFDLIKPINEHDYMSEIYVYI
jgi:hypothetical protein